MSELMYCDLQVIYNVHCIYVASMETGWSQGVGPHCRFLDTVVGNQSRAWARCASPVN